MRSERQTAEQALIMEINRVGRLYRKGVDRALAAHGLSSAAALPVIFIARLGEGVSQKIVAEHLGIEGPSLARQLDKLCAAGLVERREDRADRRMKGLHLSDSGKSLAASVEAALLDFRGAMLAKIPDADLTTTLRTLEIFAATLEDGDAR